MPPKAKIVPLARPARYWPGKAPAPEASTSDSESDQEQEHVVETVIHPKPLQKSEKTVTDLLPSKDVSDSEDEDELAKRRLKIRERAMARRKEESESEHETIPKSHIQVVDHAFIKKQSESETSEYTSSESENEIYPQRSLIKPVFVSKNNRETILEKERRENEKKEAEEERERKVQERKMESSELVMDVLRREMAECNFNLAEVVEQATLEFDIDDADGLDALEEETLWKLREFERLKRDRTIKQKRLDDIKDIERRRTMTDSQVEEENEALGKNRSEDRPKYRFMQKYYHKGAFGGDDSIENALAATDANAPTLEDHFDMSSLPSVMQVKNFGLKGRTKYTHLTDQDTTEFGREAAWNKDTVSKSVQGKMGGMQKGFARPAAKKRKVGDEK